MAQYQHKLKDKKIDIWQGVSSGGSRPTYTYSIEFGGLWAYYRQMNGNVSIDTGSGLTLFDTTERAVFIINYLPELKQKKSFGYTKIKFNGRVYDILAVDDFEGYKTEMKITAEYSSTQSYTGMDDE